MATGTIEKVTNNSGTFPNGHKYCNMPDGTALQWFSVDFVSTDYAKASNFLGGQFLDGSIDAVFTSPNDPETTSCCYEIAYDNEVKISRRPLNNCKVYVLVVGRWK